MPDSTNSPEDVTGPKFPSPGAGRNGSGEDRNGEDRRGGPSNPTSGAGLGKRRLTRRLILGTVALALVVWAVAAALKVNSAYSSAKAARAQLEEFRKSSGGSFSGLEPLTKAPDLAPARSAKIEFAKVSSDLSSPIVAPLRVVPVLGRQLGVIRTLSESSETLIGSVMGTFDDVRQTLDDARAVPPDKRVSARLDAAASLQQSLEELVEPLGTLETGTTEGLTSSVRKAQNDFVRNRDELVDSLSRAVASVKGTRTFLSGPNTYVVLAANNSEMRAGSGMFLQAGAMTIANGEFLMGDLDPTEDMALSDPVDGFDPEFQGVWNDLAPGAEWRNINLTSRFDVSGRIALDMWSKLGNGQAQGAMAVDIAALTRLLKVVGPVQITQPDGEVVELTSGNVTRYLMIQQYKNMSRDSDATGREERRSHLGEVAKAVFESFNSSDLGLEELIDALVDVGRGRHLMAWSPDPVQQAAWVELGLAGQVPENGVLFALINRGANKLDQFIDVKATMSVSTVSGSSGSGSSGSGASSDGLRHVAIDFTMTNTTPDGLPSYMTGGDPRTGVGPGDYTGYLSLNIPSGAGNPVIEGADLLAFPIDGDTRVMIAKVTISRGQSLNLSVGFDLPTGWDAIDVQPSARIPASKWSFGNQEWTDAGPERISLGG